MDLRKLMVDSAEAWVDYPGNENFKVKVSALSRTELNSLRKRHTEKVYNKKERKMEEKLSEDNFIEAFTRATVKDWKGLTLNILQDFLLLNVEGQDLEEEVPFSEEYAQLLVKESSEFDLWVNEVIFDFGTFRK